MKSFEFPQSDWFREIKNNFLEKNVTALFSWRPKMGAVGQQEFSANV
jgi:hypothetical protein